MAILWWGEEGGMVIVALFEDSAGDGVMSRGVSNSRKDYI